MPDSMTKRKVTLEQQEITYTLEQKPVKNLNLRIRKNGSVYVSASPLVPVQEIDDFVVRKGQYIIRSMEQFRQIQQYQPEPKRYVSGETFYFQGRGVRLKVSQDQKESVISDGVYLFLNVKDPEDYEKKRRMVTKYLDQQCREVFQGELDHLYPVFRKYNVEKPQLRIRDMDTRWGSCLAKKGIITLNKRLLEAPRNCIQYVVMHELCHLVHPNHSKIFYQFLTMMMPDWKQRKEALDNDMIPLK